MTRLINLFRHNAPKKFIALDLPLTEKYKLPEQFAALVVVGKEKFLNKFLAKWRDDK